MADPQIRRIILEMEGFTERQMKKLTLAIHANLVEDTPVDLGWARANWVPSIGAPVIEDLSDVQNPVSKVGPANARSQEGLVRVAAQYHLSQGPIFISNNVPYIQKLNQGSSQQAPAMFVEQAIDKGLREVRA